jgi:hypothetical protein
MKLFEYKTISTEDSDGGEALQQAGGEGWEAYSMFHRIYHSVNMPTSYYFYLKRRLAAEIQFQRS